MKPIEFEQANIKFAEKQAEYMTLLAYRADNGVVISCWQLTWKERWTLLCTGKLWSHILTFGEALQPHKFSVGNPFDTNE